MKKLLLVFGLFASIVQAGFTEKTHEEEKNQNTQESKYKQFCIKLKKQYEKELIGKLGAQQTDASLNIFIGAFFIGMGPNLVVQDTKGNSTSISKWIVPYCAISAIISLLQANHTQQKINELKADEDILFE